MLNQQKRSRARAAGFTLVELIVVAGIILLVIGITLPMLVKAIRSGSRTRVAADLNAIAMALDAYKGDFGDYPRVDQPGTGFAVLGKALIGTYGDGLTSTGLTDPLDPGNYVPTTQYRAGDCASNGGAPPTYYVALIPNKGVALTITTTWAPFAACDGADGPGIRQRAQGKTYGPYLQPEKFKIVGSSIYDSFGNPIFYFPGNPRKLNLTVTNTYYVSSYNAVPGNAYVSGGNVCVYNFDDNGPTVTSLTVDPTDYGKALARMQSLMGIRQHICANPGSGGSALGDLVVVGTPGNPAETPITTAPYLLWSCGPDGVFGPADEMISLKPDLTRFGNAVKKCDDVTNFTP